MNYDIKDAKENRINKNVMIVINADCIRCLDGIFFFPSQMNQTVWMTELLK